ncbi:MAG: tetratricopeptide repeat protein [Terracidiphilus sp.]|nr:tetratricopeptide repeat protein [Terracidiphilus sp.]
MRRLTAGAVLAVLCVLAAAAGAQEQANAATGEGGPRSSRGGRVLLVLPFDNRTGQPNLEWVREAAAEILSMRFASAGFQPTSRADRVYALDHLGLPQGFHPSRASALKLAQTLDADSIVVGSYTTDGTSIVVEASLVDVPDLRMLPAVSVRGEMRDLMGVFSALAWRLTRELDPTFNGAEETFVAAGREIRVDAFEQYIRGIAEPDQAERQRHLEQAVKLSPGFSPAWMALGREDYNQQQYKEAAEAFAKVDQGGADGLEAGFYRGLSLLFSGDYAPAVQAFADVARVLPLAEVVNNEGVAMSRQGKDGTSLFIQAAAADPNAADYHFNLALSLKRHANVPGAINEMTQCLKLRPGDSEAQALLTAWKGQAGSGAGAAAGQGVSQAGVDPLERIVRGFDAAAFKQAATVMDQMDAGRLAALPSRDRARALCAQSKVYLDRGLLLEAERLYQAAVAADGKSAEAHAGLAEVRERSGDTDAARKEAQAALELEPSASAYLVLAQLDLAAGNLGAASTDANNALKLEPSNRAAQDILRQILAKPGQK